MIDIQLFENPLNPQDCIDFVSVPGAGGISVFIGTVRDKTKGRAVVRLEFEAYKPMAISEMEKIARAAQEKWQAEKISIHHRVGD